MKTKMATTWPILKILHGNRSKWNVHDDVDNDDGHDHDDDDDETNHSSANFEATTSRFCMVIDINENIW